MFWVAIPRGAVVLADEQVGDLVSQPYCREQDAAPCLGKASCIVTWDTYPQYTQALGDAAFRTIFAHRVKVAFWEGWNGTVTARKVKT